MNIRTVAPQNGSGGEWANKRMPNTGPRMRERRDTLAEAQHVSLLVGTSAPRDERLQRRRDERKTHDLNCHRDAQQAIVGIPYRDGQQSVSDGRYQRLGQRQFSVRYLSRDAPHQESLGERQDQPQVHVGDQHDRQMNVLGSGVAEALDPLDHALDTRNALPAGINELAQAFDLQRQRGLKRRKREHGDE